MDLAVGSNLQDHLLYNLKIHTNESETITKDTAFNVFSYIQYFLLGRGRYILQTTLFYNIITVVVFQEPYSDKFSTETGRYHFLFYFAASKSNE